MVEPETKADVPDSKATYFASTLPKCWKSISCSKKQEVQMIVCMSGGGAGKKNEYRQHFERESFISEIIESV